MGVRVVALAAAAFLLATLLLASLLAGVARLLLLLVGLVSADVALLLAALLALYCFVDSRRQRVARGFYSCGRVRTDERRSAPSAAADRPWADDEEEKQAEAVRPVEGPNNPPKVTNEEQEKTRAEQDKTQDNQHETEGEGQKLQLPPAVPVKLKAFEPSVSETESEEDEDSSGSARSSASSSERRPRSRASSSASDVLSHRSRRSATAVAPASGSLYDVLPRSRRSLSSATARERRAASAAPERRSSRRDTFAGSRAALRSERQVIEDALQADGYWIGDFHLVRKRVPRPLSDGAASPRAGR